MAFYHVRITRKSQPSSDLVELDLTGPGLMKHVVRPYLEGKQFYCENTLVDPFDVEAIRINETLTSSKVLMPVIHEREEADARRSGIRVAISDRWYVTKEGEDVTRRYIKIPPAKKPESATFPAEVASSKVFIVHGHDDVSKLELARLLDKLGLEPIILHEQANRGRTLIEKLEANALDIGYAFVLLTPDDEGTSTSSNDRHYRPRARQNVVLELGFFMGKLGRQRVCCLYKGDVELPSDMHGVAYYPFENKISECLEGIVKELKDAGYRPSL